MIQFELFDRPRRCPRCKKMHLNQGYHCEHCLCDLLNHDQQIAPMLPGRAVRGV